jgi:hypothetical protein
MTTSQITIKSDRFSCFFQIRIAMIQEQTDAVWHGAGQPPAARSNRPRISGRNNNIAALSFGARDAASDMHAINASPHAYDRALSPFRSQFDSPVERQPATRSKKKKRPWAPSRGLFATAMGRRCLFVLVLAAVAVVVLVASRWQLAVASNSNTEEWVLVNMELGRAGETPQQPNVDGSFRKVPEQLRIWSVAPLRSNSFIFAKTCAFL